MNFRQDLLDSVAEFPVRIMRLEFPHIADPPDVVADPVVLFVSPVQFFAADAFAFVNRLQHRAVRVAAAADVIDFARARLLEKLPERIHQVVAVNVVAHLFAFVAKNAIRRAADGATHQIREKTVQFRARMRRAGETPAAETRRLHAEIIAVFLHQHVGRHLARAEQRMFRLVNAHRLGNARLIFMLRLNLPALFQFHQRQAVRRVAIDFVGGRENKNRFGTGFTRGLQQVQRANGVDAKIGVRIARGPVMRRLRGGVDDEFDVLAQFFEQRLDSIAVADVKVVVFVVGKALDEFFAIAQCGRFLAKKPLAQVVVNADNLEPFFGKTLDTF